MRRIFPMVLVNVCRDGTLLPSSSTFSIPPSRSIVGTISSLDDSSTPQSDSPQTPASLISPISGVVDLTKDVMTTSPFAVAHGGLSDIYLGEWHRRDADTGGIEVVIVSQYLCLQLGSSLTHMFTKVAIKLLRMLASKDSDGVKARKVWFMYLIVSILFNIPGMHRN